MVIGNVVKVIQPVIQGAIVDIQYNKDQQELEHLVEWTNADGDVQQRWFLQSELEQVA